MMEITPETPLKELPNYWNADEVKKLAGKIINKHHQHLKHSGIAYLFKKKMKHAGLASKASEKIRLVTEEIGQQIDFIITINWQVWIAIDAKQKKALVDHELYHCRYNTRGEELKPMLLKHDLEEFTEIVARHGLWTRGLEHLAEVMRDNE